MSHGKTRRRHLFISEIETQARMFLAFLWNQGSYWNVSDAAARMWSSVKQAVKTKSIHCLTKKESE